MTEGGRGVGSVRSASRTRRFMRFRVTERRAVFLETMTAYPAVPLGRTMARCGEETRRPRGSMDGNVAREIRLWRGNTGR